jgi:hypothetical protein
MRAPAVVEAETTSNRGASLGGVVRFHNQRGTAEQHIKEGKYAFSWTGTVIIFVSGAG